MGCCSLSSSGTKQNHPCDPPPLCKTPLIHIAVPLRYIDGRDVVMAEDIFSTLSTNNLHKMNLAGEQILECYRVLAKPKANIVGEVIKGQSEFFEWDHHPKGDVYDNETHSQYYYHAHPPEPRLAIYGAEHGHFHTFVRPKGMPKAVNDSLEAPLESRMLVGTTAEVTTRLTEERRRLGIDLLVARPQLGGLPRSAQESSLTLLANEVWPAVIEATSA